MFFALGLFVAGLIALMVTPAIWRRAMRLTRVRIEAGLPLTRAEIEADKDRLRAGFAIATRRLEIESGRLRERVAEQTIALSRRDAEIGTLLRDKAMVAENLTGLERRVADLSALLGIAEDRLAAAAEEATARQARLAEREAELAGARAALGASQLQNEELRLEMVARSTEIGNLTDNLAAITAAEQAGIEARDRLAAELAGEREGFAIERKRAAATEASFAALEAERATRLADLERRTTEVRTLEAAVAAEVSARAALAAEIEALKTERSRIVDQLAAARSENETGRHRQADVLAEGDNIRKAIAAIEAEKEELTQRMTVLEDDLAALRAENAELRRVAGAEWESEREESRRLRDRLNEIAAGVVRLTQSLDANGGTPAIEEEETAARPIPLAPAPRPSQGSPSSDTGEATLAERLRALQHAGARH
jgi:chromosome segregation ATPase